MKRIFVILSFVLCLQTLAQKLTAQSWSPNGPLPRSFHSAVYDTSTKRMIVFGGQTPNSSSSFEMNDVWRLYGSPTPLGGTGLNWVQVHATGTPPAPRFGHFAGYDPNSNRMIIFGGAEGRSSPCANDLWALTNANGYGGSSAWTQLNPTGGPPPARYSQQAAYDPESNTLMIYGGNDCFSTTYSDYWVLSNANGMGGTPTWTELFPTGNGPGPLQYQQAEYDPSSNELIIFGGSNGSGAYYNGVWVLAHANGQGGSPTWTQLSPTGNLPAPRACSTATYDPTTNRMTIFGGGNASSLFGDTWVLTNANGIGGSPAWMQIAESSADFPTSRSCHTAVYDPSTNVMTIFAGGIASGIASNDVFLLSDANGQ